VPELQHRFLAILLPRIPGVASIEEEVAPSWLIRPGSAEFGEAAELVGDAYTELTGLELPDVMPARELHRRDEPRDRVRRASALHRGASDHA